MVEMIHRITGCEMRVPEDQVEQFLAAGHRLAAREAPKKPELPKPKKTRKKG